MRRMIPLSSVLAKIGDSGKARIFSDNGKGAERIIDYIDGKDEEWRARYQTALMKVRRKAPKCLETFQMIVMNGKDRYKSVEMMANRTKTPYLKPPKSGISGNGASYCACSNA